MNRFARLYNDFSKADLYIPRNHIRDKVLAISGANKVSIFMATLNTAVVRGMYFSPRNDSHGLGCYAGQHVIAISRDLNRCWARFVIAKELMHMLEDHHGATDSGADFDRVLFELNSGGSLEKMSDQSKSEINAFWMALACLVPEKHRKKLKKDWEKDGGAEATRNYNAAAAALIPAVYVPRLFSDSFESNLEKLLK